MGVLSCKISKLMLCFVIVHGKEGSICKTIELRGLSGKKNKLSFGPACLLYSFVKSDQSQVRVYVYMKIGTSWMLVRTFIYLYEERKKKKKKKGEREFYKRC